MSAEPKRIVRIAKDLATNQPGFEKEKIWLGLFEEMYDKVYFCFYGLQGSWYENGQYFGFFEITAKFPFEPPNVFMLTPSGRFETNTKLCMSAFSSYHKSEWNASLSLFNVALMTQVFMPTTDSMIGGKITGEAETRELAAQSLQWNAQQTVFRAVFPHLCNL